MWWCDSSLSATSAVASAHIPARRIIFKTVCFKWGSTHCCPFLQKILFILSYSEVLLLSALFSWSVFWKMTKWILAQLRGGKSKPYWLKKIKYVLLWGGALLVCCCPIVVFSKLLPKALLFFYWQNFSSSNKTVLIAAQTLPVVYELGVASYFVTTKPWL